MRVSGRVLLLTVTVITLVSTLFCIIGLATGGWGGYGSGSLFCNGCPKSSQALSIISFILLIVTIIAFALLVFDRLQGPLRYIPFVLLFVATMFLLATFAAYFNSAIGYSYNLMVAAHFFSYIALTIAAYWYGQADASSGAG